MADNVTLEFLGAQMERMLARMDAFQDDVRVLTAIVLRHENTLNAMRQEIHEMLGQITAMVTQHSRFDNRLRRLEERAAP